VCFAKYTFSKHNLGWLGLKPIFGHSLFSSFFWGLGLAQPIWARLDLTGPAWSLAQAKDLAGQQARMTQLTRVLHSVNIIKLHSHCFLLYNIYTENREKRTLPSEDEDDDEAKGDGPSTGQRIISFSSSF